MQFELNNHCSIVLTFGALEQGSKSQWSAENGIWRSGSGVWRDGFELLIHYYLIYKEVHRSILSIAWGKK